jgi:outer membrane receptor protein involved in Fe transport
MYFANADYHVQNPNNIALFTDEYYTYTAPRLGFVWRPTAVVAVRAAAGGGFAEAPLEFLIGSNGTPEPNNFSSPTFYTVTLRNLALQPEKSFAFNLGTDVRLRHDTVISLDLYRANLYGQLYNSSTLTGTYTGVYGTLPLYTTQYGNLGESRYEGILLDLRHDVSRGLYWSLSGGLTRGYIVSLPTGFYNLSGGAHCNFSTGASCTNLYVVPGPNFNGIYTNGASIPYSQALGILGYRWNPEKYVGLVATYYGNNNTYFRPAFVELDGRVGYSLTKNTSLLLTFRNITGIYDQGVQVYSAASYMGVPTITGLPYAETGEEYGPRTVIITMNIHG